MTLALDVARYKLHGNSNTTATRYLNHALSSGRIANAYLFAGPSASGKQAYAEAFAAALLGSTKAQHPDLHIYRPSGKLSMHSIESIRRFSGEVALTPLEGERKVFIIEEAQRMLPTAANALLKTLEEPSLDTVIILLASEPTLLLPTILSRCVRLNFQQAAIDAAAPLASYQETLLVALQHGHFSSWMELHATAKDIAGAVEAVRAVSEAALQAELPADQPSDLSAVQRQALEKEIEGQATARYMQAVDLLFETLLGWYRDVLLLKSDCDPKWLLYPQFSHGTSHQSLNASPSLDRILQICTEGRLAVERQSPLAMVLETMFLRLQLA